MCETEIVTLRRLLSESRAREKALVAAIDGVGNFNDGCGCCGDGAQVDTDDDIIRAVEASKAVVD